MPVVPQNLLFPARTILGAGRIVDLLPEAAAFGFRGLLVHGHSFRLGGTLDQMLACMPPGMDVRTWEHEGGEPTVDQLEALRCFARGHAPQWVAAVGGGSVLDLGKGCAGLLDAPLPVEAYHDGEKIPRSAIPFIAVPTTAGTGSEATPVVVLTNPRRLLKSSFRHPSFMPRLVILDADLLANCPPEVVAASGMDALAQAIESYVSRHATWFTEQLSLEAIRLILGSLEDVYRGRNGDKRQNLLVGSFLAGVALANARLGVVHGLAHPLGVRYRVPHGLACAACLLPVLEFNRPVLREKYRRMCEWAGGDITDAIGQLMAALEIRSPFKAGSLTDEEAIVAETLASGSTAANPRPVTRQDVLNLLAGIFGLSSRADSHKSDT
ncbi:MAG: iron-containing alcohol dehydrogenase [Kiritimatiellae bacterium]|nr:iron-containing alcohol dehydrogenase [Kiritimatiellia bacterium]